MAVVTKLIRPKDKEHIVTKSTEHGRSVKDQLSFVEHYCFMAFDGDRVIALGKYEGLLNN